MNTIKGSPQALRANNNETEMKSRKVVLSTLWIFVMFNYLYADVYGLYFQPILQKEMWKEFLSGYAGTVQVTQGFVLVTAILMETAIAMVLVSRVLKYRPNRWANILMGAFHTLFVSWSLIGDTPSLFYGFFAMIEIVCTLFIAWYAWTWRDSEG
jgi:hypothetical protein